MLFFSFIDQLWGVGFGIAGLVVIGFALYAGVLLQGVVVRWIFQPSSTEKTRPWWVNLSAGIPWTLLSCIVGSQTSGFYGFLVFISSLCLGMIVHKVREKP